MAQVNLYVRSKKRWWFYLYYYCLWAFIWTVAPFFDEDDDRLDTFIDNQMRVLIRCGIVIEYRAGNGRWKHCTGWAAEPSGRFVIGNFD